MKSKKGEEGGRPNIKFVMERGSSSVFLIIPSPPARAPPSACSKVLLLRVMTLDSNVEMTSV